MPPRERQKLQPRGIEAILNSVQNRQNTNQNRWEGAGGEGPYPVWNQPNPQERLHSLDEFSPGWLEASLGGNNINNTGIISAAMADNRTSRNPNTWHQSPYFGIGGYDFVEDHAPEYLDYFQDIKDKDAMERDAGWRLYATPSWIENEPSYGLDYMMDIFGGKGQLGFRGDVDDDKWNAYAKWGIEL